MSKQSNPVCPFCNAELEEDMFDSTYGCDTGCEYITIEIECPDCGKVMWRSGEFGSLEGITEEEKQETHDRFMQEFVKELERIKRLTEGDKQ